MARTAPGSISRLNACSGPRTARSERNANGHEKNKAHPRVDGRKIRRLTELNLFQIDAHDASFSFIRGLTSRLNFGGALQLEPFKLTTVKASKPTFRPVSAT